MRKGDKGKKVFGVVVILAIIVSVFGGAVSAEDVSVDLTKSFADVTRTLYVHEGSVSGPLLSGARVTGQDGAGNSFASGYVTITGTPGSWQFTASKSGYQSSTWTQSITTTCERHAFLEKDDVTLTLYVHDGSVSGPLLSGARVTGQDGAGNSFDKTTSASGYVTITGTPGTWQFRISKSGYKPVEWDLDITTTCERHAYFSEEVYYDSQAAVNYAISYAYKACGCGGYYGSSPPPQGSGTPLGSNGDCAHFVSHCLAAGGLSNKGTAYATGWCEGGAHDYIISVSKMREWFMDQELAHPPDHRQTF